MSERATEPDVEALRELLSRTFVDDPLQPDERKLIQQAACCCLAHVEAREVNRLAAQRDDANTVADREEVSRGE